MMMLWLLLAALLLAPAAAAALLNEGDQEPVSAAHAEAGRLIEEADVGDWFVNVTEGAVPEAKHLASGLRCASNLVAPTTTSP